MHTCLVSLTPRLLLFVFMFDHCLCAGAITHMSRTKWYLIRGAQLPYIA